MKHTSFPLLLLAALLCSCGAATSSPSGSSLSSSSSAQSFGEEVTYSFNISCNGVKLDQFFLYLRAEGHTYYDFIDRGTASITAPEGVYEISIDDLPEGFSLVGAHTEVGKASYDLSVEATPRTTFDAYHTSFIGDVPLDFTYDAVENVDGQLVKTPMHYAEEAKKHKIMMINIFSTFCGPCKAEFPYFQEIFSDETLPYANEVGLLAIDDGVFGDGSDSAQLVANLRDTLGITSFPTLWTDDPLCYNYPSDEGYLYFPTTVIIDQCGLTASIEYGSFSSVSEVKEFFDYYLADDYAPSYMLTGSEE